MHGRVSLETGNSPAEKVKARTGGNEDGKDLVSPEQALYSLYGPGLQPQKRSRKALAHMPGCARDSHSVFS